MLFLRGCYGFHLWSIASPQTIFDALIEFERVIEAAASRFVADDKCPKPVVVFHERMASPAGIIELQLDPRLLMPVPTTVDPRDHTEA
jgi:hypothetical protein